MRYFAETVKFREINTPNVDKPFLKTTLFIVFILTYVVVLSEVLAEKSSEKFMCHFFRQDVLSENMVHIDILLRNASKSN
jgi:hypothetical protein